MREIWSGSFPTLHEFRIVSHPCSIRERNRMSGPAGKAVFRMMNARRETLHVQSEGGGRTMKRNTLEGLVLGIAFYVIYSLLTLYFRLLNGWGVFFVLGNRIIWTAAFMLVLILIRGGGNGILAALRNRYSRCWLSAGMAFILMNWGLFIWGVNHSHVLDISLANLLNPLVSLVLGVFVFHDDLSKLDYAAVAIAAAGIMISMLAFHSVPWFALVHCLWFSLYGLAQKKVQALDPFINFGTEMLLGIPVAAVLLVIDGHTGQSFRLMDGKTLLLLLGSGAVTSVPMILYSRSIRNLNLSTMGFLQYVSPVVYTVIGVFILGEELTAERILCNIFVVAALIVFSVSFRKKQAKGGSAEANRQGT